METVDALIRWLVENESALSAIAAATVIIGVFYGFLRFVFAPIIRRYSAVKRQRKIAAKKADSSQSSNVKRTKSESNSVTVLLLDNKSNAEEDTYLASGITSEVIALITKVPSIRVSSRASSYGFVSNQVDLKEVSETLQTHYVLAGSLHHVKGKIRVIVHLYDAHQDEDIWAHQYDRELADIFDVQHDIAQRIVASILGEVKLAEAIDAQKKPTEQLDAWGLVQKAYHFWLTSFSPEAMLEACDLLRQAIKLDPNYATAKATLAMILSNLMTLRIAPDYDATADEAKAMIESAFKQAPNDIDVLENAGVVWQNLGEKTKAEMALRKVGKLAPLNLIARGYLALLLSLVKGKAGAEEAITILNKNLSIAPNHPSVPYWDFFLSMAKQALEHREEAIEHAQSSLIGQPGWAHNYFVMANAYCELDNVEAAKQCLTEAGAINPYLTPALYAENVNRITQDEKLSQPFIGGLIKQSLV